MSAEALASGTPATQDDWEAHWGDYASTAEDNPAQAYRRRRAFALLAGTGPVERLLDIGAGQGDLLRSAAAEFPGAALAGLELSATGVAQCRAKVPGADVVQRNLLVDGAVDPTRAGWATHAVCSEVLEHVDDPARLLRNACAYLQPGAWLVITVPGGPRSAFDKHIGHRRHFSQASLAEVIGAAGLAVERVEGAGFPVFNLYKLLVIARGKRLIDDVRASSDGGSGGSRAAGRAMRGFERLFRHARDDSRWGWQLVALARSPA